MIVRISPRAEKELKRISKLDQLAIGQKIRSLATADPLGTEKLTGFPHVFRVRVGSYRIVYKKSKNEVYIVLIGHRKDIYRKLSDIFG